MEQPLRPDIISLICKYSKGCSHIYSLFQAHEKKESKSLRKWKIHFNIDDKAWQTYCNINFKSTIDVELKPQDSFGIWEKINEIIFFY